MVVRGLRDRHLHLTEPIQKAVITWDDHKETLILAAAVKSDDISNFAWVIPIQSKSKPEVTAGDIRIFEDLVDYFGRSKVKPSRFDGLRTERAQPGVRVIETKEVDIYDITILKAKDPKDLLDWLNANGYGVPDNAVPVLKEYTRRDDTYFVANRIDLKNRHTKEIEETERILTEAEQRHDRLCGEIDSILRAHGIDEVCQKHKYHKGSEVLAVIQDAIHDPGNPLGLPRKWSTDLGAGLTVEELCTAIPRFVREADRSAKTQIEFHRPKDRQWALALFRDGSFVDVIDYLPYGRSGHSPRYLSKVEALSRLTKSKLVPRQGISLVRGYLARRESYHAVTEVDGQCSSRLKVLAQELSAGLARNAWEQYGLNRNLYGGSKPLRDKSGSRADLTFAETFAHVYGSIAKGKQRQRLGGLRRTINELKKGIATPLKFVFGPGVPGYPLLISSLNAGWSHIEVYFIGEAPVVDGNGVLKVDASKAVSPRLRGKLGKHLDVRKARHVTRLVYRGALKALKADAVFRPAVASGTGKDDVFKKKELNDKTLWRQKIQVAQRKDTPPGVLALLAQDQDDSVRMEVADNPNTPPDALRVLATDSFNWVRHRVAGNPGTPPKTLAGLAGDDFGEVKFVLLGNPNTPGETVGEFAGSESPKLRLMVARHPNTPTVVLKRLSSDEDGKVVDTARKALQQWE